MLAWAGAATGLMTIPRGRFAPALGCGEGLPCMPGGGGYGYGISCGPYGEATGRIIPGGMGIHIGAGAYCGDAVLGSIGRGMGLGLMAGAYIMRGLGELIMGEGYPLYCGCIIIGG